MTGRESGYGGQLGVAAAVCDTSILVSQTVVGAIPIEEIDRN